MLNMCTICHVSTIHQLEAAAVDCTSKIAGCTKHSELVTATLSLTSNTFDKHRQSIPNHAEAYTRLYHTNNGHSESGCYTLEKITLKEWQ